MKKREFIYTSKNMLKEYFNSKNEQKISLKDIHVIGFNDDLTGFQILLSVPTSKELYGVNYDMWLDKLNSYIYHREGKRIIGKREKKKLAKQYQYFKEDDE